MRVRRPKAGRNLPPACRLAFLPCLNDRGVVGRSRRCVRAIIASERLLPTRAFSRPHVNRISILYFVASRPVGVRRVANSIQPWASAALFRVFVHRSQPPTGTRPVGRRPPRDLTCVESWINLAGPGCAARAVYRPCKAALALHTWACVRQYVGGGHWGPLSVRPSCLSRTKDESAMDVRNSRRPEKREKKSVFG